MRRLTLLSLLWVAVAVVAAPDAAAQAIRLTAERTSLETVLQQLAAQAGIDVVYAQRLVEGKAVTGRYLGGDPEQALATVLRDSGLRAERLRPGQYVIVPVFPTPRSEPEPYRGTLVGTVVDGETNEVLPGAHVVLVGLGIGTATNASGYFALPGLPAGVYRVRISYVGYRTAEEELSVYPETSELPPTVRLRPQVIAGGEAVVEGREGERSDLLPVPGTDALDVRQAAAIPAFLGESDLFQALEWLPGVGRAGEAGGELVIRGSDAHFNRYLLDGAPIIHPWHTFGLFSTFQIEALKSVRLYKGSFPAEYGGGLSSVLDVEMKDGDRDEAAGTVALSPVSFRTVAELPLGRGASLMLSGRRSYLDLLFSPQVQASSSALFFTEDEVAPDAQQELGYYFYDVGAKVTLRPSRFHRLSLSYYEGGDDLSADVPFASLISPAAGSGTAPLGLELGYGWGNRVASARYRYLYGRRLFLTTTAYYSRYRATELANAQPTASSLVDSDYRVRFAESGLAVDADYYYSLEHQFRLGARFVGRTFESTLEETILRADTGDGTVRTQRDAVRALEGAVYLQDTWQPSPEWQVQPGLRVEVFGLGPYVSVSPRVNVRYVVTPERLFVKAGVSRQVQYLHRLRDRYSYTYDLASSRWIPASEDVRPAVGWQASAGLEAVPADWVSLGVDVYGRQLGDILLPADEFQVKDGIEGPGILPGALLAQYVAGSGRSFGIEMAAQAERGRWRFGLSYAFARSHVRSPGEVYRRARYDAPHTLKGLVQGALGRWTLSLSATVRSGYPVTVPVARYALGDVLDGDDEGPTYYLVRPTINNGRLPVYARADLAVGYTFELLGMDWDASVQAYNLLNRRNTVGQTFDPGPPTVTATDVRGLPLLPMINIKGQW
jgi:hypothetical protein